MIPDGAVEAAHKAWRQQAGMPGTIFEYNLRAALEAAAPYMKADAWDEGERVGFEESFRDNDPRPTRNPYRSRT